MTNLGLYTVPICATFADPAEGLQSSSLVLFFYHVWLLQIKLNKTTCWFRFQFCCLKPIINYKSNYNYDNYSLLVQDSDFTPVDNS